MIDSLPFPLSSLALAFESNTPTRIAATTSNKTTEPPTIAKRRDLVPCIETKFGSTVTLALLCGCGILYFVSGELKAITIASLLSPNWGYLRGTFYVNASPLCVNAASFVNKEVYSSVVKRSLGGKVLFLLFCFIFKIYSFYTFSENLVLLFSRFLGIRLKEAPEVDKRNRCSLNRFPWLPVYC